MSQRDHNFSAAIYVATGAGLMLVGLILVLVLPFPIFPHSLGWTAVLASFVGIPVLDRWAHRSRIAEAIRAAGGTVIRIKREPFWRQPRTAWRLRKVGMARRIKYRVEYEDLLRVRRESFCLSGWFHGVEWIADGPEDGLSGKSPHVS